MNKPIKHYLKEMRGLVNRVSNIGILSTINEITKYLNRYNIKEINTYTKLKYKLNLFYEYSKICFYKPNIVTQDLLDFIPNKYKTIYLLHKINPLNEKVELVNKIFFYRKLTGFSIPHPKTFFYIKNGMALDLYDNKINGLELFEDKKYFVKSVSGSLGYQADIIYFKQASILNYNNLLFQEIIKNHSAIEILAPGLALNGVRLQCYLTKSNQVEINSAAIYLSTKGFTNNHPGFISVPMYKDTGKLMRYGFSTITGGNIEKHPNSTIDFKDYEIPFWPEVMNLVNNLHSLFKNLRCISWDIAITENGPLVIEGNSGGNFFTPQISVNPFYKMKLIQENLSE